MQFDWPRIIVIALIVLFVLSINVTLLGLMRGDKTIRAEASKWGLAVGGGQKAQRQNDANADALHAAVTDLQPPPPDPNTPPPHE
jgi:hypothetical protein